MPSSSLTFTALLLGRAALEHAHADPALRPMLNALRKRNIPSAWLDDSGDLPLLDEFPEWPPSALARPDNAPWPAPDACWQALMGLNAARIEGCVLVSGAPGLLQAGLNAGLWTVGLASCALRTTAKGASHQAAWQQPGEKQLELQRSQATLELYRLGVHSVIDHLGELGPCLDDILQRRISGEKP